MSDAPARSSRSGSVVMSKPTIDSTPSRPISRRRHCAEDTSLLPPVANNKTAQASVQQRAEGHSMAAGMLVSAQA